MKVSIITVVYNGEKTIRDSIESVLRQDYPSIEYILIDGGSSDKTVEIIHSYGSKIARVVSERDKGIYDAMNKGISYATGDLIGILNADDLYAYDSAISDVVAAVSHDNTDGAYGDLVYVDPTLTQIKRRWISGMYRKNLFNWGWMPPHPTFFLRKEWYQKYGNFRLDMGSAADYELMLRMIHKQKANLSYIPRVMIKMRIGGVSNQNILNRIKANKSDRKAWVVNDLKPYFFTLWLKPIRKVMQYVYK
ncbi:glycosyltransferase family 2 protein [Telluribacter humicola]|uniref:glycosyltransferase family 2 protein n=1 Tax=Telluribacter humicola TaxID=1720261 RepID=UPI001A9688D3|nr:glycosyltransferase family 2 protein [Telluribacter humicola]